MTNKLVPIEPTEEMIKAAWAADECVPSRVEYIYKAMLSAAPPQETVEEMLAKVPLFMDWSLTYREYSHEYSFRASKRDKPLKLLMGDGATPAEAIRNALERVK